MVSFLLRHHFGGLLHVYRLQHGVHRWKDQAKGGHNFIVPTREGINGVGTKNVPTRLNTAIKLGKIRSP